MDDSSKILVAMAKFLVEVNPRLPSFWYSAFGCNMGSLSFLFGMEEESFIQVLTEAGVLYSHGGNLRFSRDTFYKGFDLLVGGHPKSIEAERFKLNDPNQIATCNMVVKRTTQWYVHIGASTAMRDWKSFANAYKQMKAGVRPPRASLNLSRQLFQECESIRNSLLLDKLYASNAKPSAELRQEKEDPTDLVMSSPPATRPNSTPTNPVVTPSAVLTLEDDMAVESGMPFLDSFVGKQDKSDKTKLAGVLKETVGILAPGKHNRSLKISSANGTDTLLTMVLKSKSESGFCQNAHKSKWLTDVLEHARPSAAEGATSVARFICCNHSEEFHELARDAGLSPMESMDMTASEAMIQDANLSNKQLQTVRRHVTYATGENFKMGYRHSELEKMEQNETGPQPYFGVYKIVNNKVAVENCKHWSTPINDEASFAVENDVLNRAANTKFIGPLFPEEVGVVVGLDHGQGAMRGFAKFLLTSPQLHKEKNDLSYGCPIANLCHVQCKKDTYLVVRDTVTNSLVESIEYLQQNKLVVVSNKSRDVVQAVYVPKGATNIRINNDHQLELEAGYDGETITDTKELGPDIQVIPCDEIIVDCSIQHFRIYITGNLAFYALMLGRPNSANHWCIWCDSKKQYYGYPAEVAQKAANWTVEKLKVAKYKHDNRRVKSQAIYLGVQADVLIDNVEPQDYIFCVLHDQIGLVNKSLGHLLAIGEKHIEKLPEGHAETRTELLSAEESLEVTKSRREEFVNTGKVHINELKSAATLTTEDKDEMEELKVESKRLDSEVTGAQNRKKAAKKAYDDMRNLHGKTDGSFAYLMDESLKAIGAKMQAWHGGELNGVSARLVMENSDSLFNLIEKNLIDIKHADSQYTDEDIKTMMKNYRHMYTSLGASYSFLQQILPSDDDLRNLRENIECARKIWVENLKISATPKAHSLFDGHAYEQHERLGGIGDKLEDFVEKGHQIGMRDKRRTWNMRNWEQMQRSQIRHDRRRNRPEVCERICLVHHSKKRKLKRLEQGGETKSAPTKRVKEEESVVKREANLVASSSLFN